MSRIAEISQVWQNRREWPEADHHQNFEVLIRQRVSLLWKYCLGRVKGDLGFIDIEGDSLARGRADRVERKTLRNQRVYA